MIREIEGASKIVSECIKKNKQRQQKSTWWWENCAMRSRGVQNLDYLSYYWFIARDDVQKVKFRRGVFEKDIQIRLNEELDSLLRGEESPVIAQSERNNRFPFFREANDNDDEERRGVFFTFTFFPPCKYASYHSWHISFQWILLQQIISKRDSQIQKLRETDSCKTTPLPLFGTIYGATR